MWFMWFLAGLAGFSRKLRIEGRERGGVPPDEDTSTLAASNLGSSRPTTEHFYSRSPFSFFPQISVLCVFCLSFRYLRRSLSVFIRS